MISKATLNKDYKLPQDLSNQNISIQIWDQNFWRQPEDNFAAMNSLSFSLTAPSLTATFGSAIQRWLHVLEMPFIQIGLVGNHLSPLQCLESKFNCFYVFFIWNLCLIKRTKMGRRAIKCWNARKISHKHSDMPIRFGSCQLFTKHCRECSKIGDHIQYM